MTATLLPPSPPILANSLYSLLAEKIAPSPDGPEPTTVLGWAERYRQIDGHPFDLGRFEPLRAIYEDEHPDIVVIKPAQRGVSEWAVNYASFAIDRGASVWTEGRKTGLNVGYIFPTKESLNDFSKERFSGLVEETDYLQHLFEDGDDFNAVTFKQVGQSYLYLRGGWSTRALKSFPADVIILDEYDEMAAGAPALARRRMNASVVRRSLRISTPTVPGRGIHDLYLQSDRRVYEQRHACGAWVSFDFWRDVRVDGQPYQDADGKGWRVWPAELIRASDVRLHCPACREPLTDEERCAPGRWRAEVPDVKGLRGYWVPWWPFPVADLVEYAVTAVSQDPSELTELYRSDLGLPYESSGSRITREMLSALSHGLPNGVLPDGPWRDTTMGVDVGTRFHYRVSSHGEDGKRHVRAAGSVATWDELDVLMITYGVRLCVIDAFPEQHAARAFVDRHKGKAATATYPTANALKGVLLAPDAVKAVSDGRVQINRTMAMDAVYAAVATGQERWPAALHNDPEVVEHMTAPVRVTTLDAHGQPRADWVHTKPDHLYHACLVAGTLVRSEHGEIPIEQIRAGMRVWTRDGLRRVRAAVMTAQDAEVFTYRFSNGASLTGTPNHPIHTEARGFVPLDATVYDDIITVWSESKRLSIVASCSAAIRRARAAAIECTTRPVAGIAPTVSSDCTRKSGRTSTAPFPPGISSTIVTRIRSTTILTTSSACRTASIARSTRQSSGRLASMLIGSGRSLISGTVPTRGDAGTASTLRRRSGRPSHESTSATTAVQLSRRCRPLRMIHVGLAPTPVTARRGGPVGLTTWIVSAQPAARPSESTAIGRPLHARASAVRPSGSVAAGRADVFNLSVEGTEEYFANGLLVHNCVYDLIAARLMPAGVPAVAPGGTAQKSFWRG